MAPRCQCTSDCAKPPLKGQAFCKQHMNSCSVVSPLTGYEPNYEPDTYNNQFAIKDSNNCFAYAFMLKDKPEQTNAPFHQPGLKAGFPAWRNVDGKRCPDLIARVKGDIPDIQMTTFDTQCPKGTSKVAVVVDSENDYHFYRQDKPRKNSRKQISYWSHKPGSTNVSRHDATKHLIYNPELADRDYKHTKTQLNYEDFCGFLCAPRTRNLSFKRGGRTRRTRRTKRTTRTTQRR